MLVALHLPSACLKSLPSLTINILKFVILPSFSLDLRHQLRGPVHHDEPHGRHNILECRGGEDNLKIYLR